jgi:hypothetical protein
MENSKQRARSLSLTLKLACLTITEADERIFFAATAFPSVKGLKYLVNLKSRKGGFSYDILGLNLKNLLTIDLRINYPRKQGHDTYFQ